MGTASSQTLVNPDGSRSLRAYVAPAFRNDGGDWAPVDDRLTGTGTAADPFRAGDEPVPVTLNSSSRNAVVVHAPAGDVTFSLPGFDLSRPSRSGQTLTFRDVAPAADLRVVVALDAISVDLVLRSGAAQPTFAMHVADPNNVLGHLDSLGGGAFEASRNLDSGLTFELASPVAYHDGNDPVSATSGSAHQSVTASGDGFDVTDTVDPSWLTAQTFPIVLDPTMTFGAATATHCEQAYAGVQLRGSCSGSSFPLDYEGGMDWTQIIKFNLGGLPIGATITSASLDMYQPNRASGSWTSVSAYQLTSAWSSWSTYPSAASSAAATTSVSPLSPGYYAWDLTQLVTSWAAGSTPNDGVRLVSGYHLQRLAFVAASPGIANETPYLSVTYALPSGTGASVTPNSTQSPYRMSLTPTMSVTTSDPAGRNARLDVQVYNSAHALVTSGSSGFLSPGSVATWTVPWGMLSAGSSYTFTWRVEDTAGATSAWTDYGYYLAPSVPDPPTDVTVAVQGTNGLVEWQPPDSDGGSAITSYTVTTSPWMTPVTTSSTSATIPNLVSGTSYTFSVTATNALGTGDPMAADVVSATPPTAPLNLDLESAGSGQLSLDWDTPASAVDDQPNSLTGYTVMLFGSPGNNLISTTTTDADTETASFPGLTDGLSYYATVTPTNRFGSGPPTTSTTIMSGLPVAITGLDATSSDGQVTVTWDAPAVTPDTVLVQATPEGGGNPTSKTVNGSVTTATLSGLVNGTSYDVTAAAANARGSTQVATVKGVMPQSLPIAPSNVTLTGLGGAIQARWVAPPSLTPDSDFTVSLFDIGGALVDTQTVANDSTSVVFDGLSNLSRYDVQVATENESGISAPAISAYQSASGSQDRNAADYTVDDITPDFVDTHAPLAPSPAGAAVLQSEASMADALRHSEYVPGDPNDGAANSSTDDPARNGKPNNVGGCGNTPVPPCSDSYYVTDQQLATTSNGASMQNYLYARGYYERNMRYDTAILEFGSVHGSKGLKLYGDSVGTSWNTVAKRASWFLKGWMKQPAHGGPQQDPEILDVVLTTNNSGTTSVHKEQDNGEKAPHALHSELQKVADDLNAVAVDHGFYGYVTIDGGSDDEASSAFNGPTPTLAWANGFQSEHVRGDDKYSQTNNVAFFTSCGSSACWSNTHKDHRGWSVSDEYQVLGGIPSAAGLPQIYDYGWGDYYHRIDHVSAAKGHQVPTYDGVEYGCGAGDIANPGDSWTTFRKYVHQRVPTLTRQFGLGSDASSCS